MCMPDTYLEEDGRVRRSLTIRLLMSMRTCTNLRLRMLAIICMPIRL